MRRPDDLADDDRDYLLRLCAREPTIAAPYQLGEGFFEPSNELPHRNVASGPAA